MARSAYHQRIVDAVKGQTHMVVWDCPGGLVAFTPGESDLAVSTKLHLEDLGEPPPMTLLVCGTTGIAALDPNWDGDDVFECPECGKAHATDDMFADNFWSRVNCAQQPDQG